MACEIFEAAPISCGPPFDAKEFIIRITREQILAFIPFYVLE
jgi:hypothetical protein